MKVRSMRLTMEAALINGDPVTNQVYRLDGTIPTPTQIVVGGIRFLGAVAKLTPGTPRQ
jgi:hypothetical protein